CLCCRVFALASLQPGGLPLSSVLRRRLFVIGGLKVVPDRGPTGGDFQPAGTGTRLFRSPAHIVSHIDKTCCARLQFVEFCQCALVTIHTGKHSFSSYSQTGIQARAARSTAASAILSDCRQ